MEAEFVGLTNSVTETRWLSNIMRDLNKYDGADQQR